MIRKRMSLKNVFFTFCWIIGAMMILAPAGSTVYAADQTAVVATVAADYSAGAHSVISVDPVGGPRTAQNNLAPTISDITVVAHGDYFYRIEKFNADNVTKFHIDDPDTPVWQYSTLDNPSDPTSNPNDMIFVSDQKAYIVRYGSTKAWIVNPSAANEDDFKIGELDLSAYDDGDGAPEMRSGVIVDGKLFIIMQRLTRANWPDPWTTNTSYVAVFDTATDTEIDTGKGTGAMLGIPMDITNLNAIQYLPDNDTIYVQGTGWYGVEFSGGIQSLDPDTYDIEMVLDDGDDADHPYGNISGMAVVSATKGYFVGYAGWGDNTLYSFDPSQTAPTGTAVSGLENKNIAGMESGVYTDDNDMLWVCNQTDHRVDILDIAYDTIDESVDTGLNPIRVAFVGGEAGSGDGGGGGGCFIGAAADFAPAQGIAVVLALLGLGVAAVFSRSNSE